MRDMRDVGFMNNLNTNLPSGRNSKGESYPENENRYPEVTHMKQRRAKKRDDRARIQSRFGHILRDGSR